MYVHNGLKIKVSKVLVSLNASTFQRDNYLNKSGSQLQVKLTLLILTSGVFFQLRCRLEQKHPGQPWA